MVHLMQHPLSPRRHAGDSQAFNFLAFRIFKNGSPHQGTFNLCASNTGSKRAGAAGARADSSQEISELRIRELCKLSSCNTSKQQKERSEEHHLGSGRGYMHTNFFKGPEGKRSKIKKKA